MTEWQPIETAPTSGTVLIYCLGYGVMSAWFDTYWTNGSISDPDNGHSEIRYHPTHWMPLPEVPK